MIDGSIENNIKLNVDAFCKGKWISWRDLCPLLCDNDYPLVLTILHQFLHPKAKKQSPTLPPALNVFISAVPAAAAVLVLFLAFAVRSTFPNGDRPELDLEHEEIGAIKVMTCMTL